MKKRTNVFLIAILLWSIHIAILDRFAGVGLYYSPLTLFKALNCPVGRFSIALWGIALILCVTGLKRKQKGRKNEKEDMVNNVL